MYSIDKLNRREFIGAAAAGASSLLLPGREAVALSRQARSQIIQPYNRERGQIFDGLVGTRAGNLYGFGGNPKIMSRTAHVATTDIFDIRLAWANTYWNENDNLENTPSTSTTYMAGVEWNGNFLQFTTERLPSKLVAPGVYIETDSLFLPTRIPAGSTFFSRQYLQSSGSTCVGYCKNQNAAKGDLCNLNASTDQTTGGTITNSGTNWSPPLAVLGRTNGLSVGVWGDSIGYGPLDESANAPTDFRRGLVCHGFPADTLAFTNMCNSTVQASNYLAACTARKNLWKYYSHIISGLGRNDITLAGRTPAQLITDLATLRGLCHPRTKFIQCTLTPDTSGTWADDAGQSYRGQEANRLSFNTQVRAILAGFQGFIETDFALESVAQIGKWLANQTGDGIHPNGPGYITGSAATSNYMPNIYR